MVMKGENMNIRKYKINVKNMIRILDNNKYEAL